MTHPANSLERNQSVFNPELLADEFRVSPTRTRIGQDGDRHVARENMVAEQPPGMSKYAHAAAQAKTARDA